MREIRFKIWNKNTKNYIDHDSISYSTTSNPIDGLEIKNHGEYIYLQYTGLKDKNGKEIYEGDIVNCLCFGTDNHIAVIAFSDGMFGIEWEEHTTTRAQLKLNGWAIVIEVIGNIYENPELLNDIK